MKKLLFVLLVLSHGAFAQDKAKAVPDYLQLQPVTRALSFVMMHDVVSPPVAARYYAYGMLGAYDIISRNESSVPPLSSIIKSYVDVPVTVDSKDYDYRIAAVYCILETGRLMLPSGYMLKPEQEKYVKLLEKNKFSKKIIEQSIAVADKMAAAVVLYSKGDNYGRLSARVMYTPLQGDAYWYPTPPSYMAAVEPHWKTIRPMVMDSCDEFEPVRPVPFSKDSGSAFYALAKQVYDAGVDETKEHVDIASFWDCNPFTVESSGHMMIGFKKITPGGHWMNIAGIVARDAHLGLDASVVLNTMTSVALMDAFISSWDEKYRSNRIRPETYINRYIDPQWQPLLQTPPFPEYTSAHSVISTAAATVLTYLMGDHFSFTDNSEQIFGLAPRWYHNFREAADEAAISRMYGGIHFHDAIVNGQTQGEGVGDKVVERMKAAGIKPLR